MDKWLWAARFFKTRSLAARACELGRIQSNGQPAKASREVRVGDSLQVKNDGGDYQVKVLLLSQVRGPATVAQMLYCETEESRDLRLKLAEERKTLPHFEASREGNHRSAIAANSTGLGADRDHGTEPQRQAPIWSICSSVCEVFTLLWGLTPPFRRSRSTERFTPSLGGG
jgi:ribosome-associated heat shock protein Hsp15